VSTAIIGTYLMRAQGALALGQIKFIPVRSPRIRPNRWCMARLILFAGALLLTPGFFTDAIGFALLIPGVRTAAFKAVRSKVSVSGVHMGGTTGPRQPQPHRPMQGDVIDGEYHELSEQDRGAQAPVWLDRPLSAAKRF